MDVRPAEPAQVVREPDWMSPSVMTGRPSIRIVASWMEAVAVEVPGLTDVTTLAHRLCALTAPEIDTTHGGATVVAELVPTGPVSGVGAMLTRPLAAMPYARPVMCGHQAKAGLAGVIAIAATTRPATAISVSSLRGNRPPPLVPRVIPLSPRWRRRERPRQPQPSAPAGCPRPRQRRAAIIATAVRRPPVR